jgi:hypothetical protein
VDRARPRDVRARSAAPPCGVVYRASALAAESPGSERARSGAQSAVTTSRVAPPRTKKPRARLGARALPAAATMRAVRYGFEG